MYESLDDIEREFLDIDSEIDKAIDSDENGEESQNESVAIGLTSLIAGGVLSFPFLTELFGRIFKVGEKVIRKYSGMSTDEVTAGEKIIKWSHSVHHKLLKPFEKISKYLFKDPKRAHEFSEFLFYLAIAGFLLIGFEGKVKPEEIAGSNQSLIVAYNSYMGALSAKKLVGAMELAKYAAIIVRKKVKKEK